MTNTLLITVLILSTLVASLGVLFNLFILIVLNQMRDMHRRRASEPIYCGHIVSWHLNETARCVLRHGHATDHAVTLASLEKIGYAQAPF